MPAGRAERDEALVEASSCTSADEQQRVGARPDRQVLVGLRGGAAAARVDDDEPAAARRASRAMRPRASGAVISAPLDASGLAPSISR